MNVREVQTDQRLIVGMVVPYDETTYRVPGGERIKRGAFARSIQNRGDRIPLLRGHANAPVYGYSRSFAEEPGGLVGEFVVNDGEMGDTLLGDVRNGYYPAMSIGFDVPRNGMVRGADGVPEVHEGKLVEVSLVGIPAYESASVLAVRSADVSALMAPFENIPAWDLDPLPPFVYRPRRAR